MRFRFFHLFLILPLCFAGCMKYGPREKEDVPEAGRRGVFIVCEGVYPNGNASLSYYNIEKRTVENEVFARRNAAALGNVAQSMTIHAGTGYIAVNNSSVVYAVDPVTFEYRGAITNLTSPRHIHFPNDGKGYISDLYAGTVTVFDPAALRVTGTVITGAHKSTGRMVGFGRYVFANCWSYDDTVLVIDADDDRVVAEIEVGSQPKAIAMDWRGKLWALCDGGYSGSKTGREAPSLYRIDASSRAVEKVFTFEEGDNAADLCIDGEGRTVYVLKDHLWRMDAGADEFPVEPFIRNTTGNYWYAAAVDPRTGEVYLADAVDYTQPGTVYRYSPSGECVDKFRVGVIPGSFCFFDRDE